MADEQLTPACTQIHDWVNQELGRKEVTGANRASSASQCVKKRWLQNQGEEGEPLQPRSILVFATGDMVEHVLKYFIAKACVGPGKLYSQVDFGVKDGTFTIQQREFDIYRQETTNLLIGGLTIPGHADGWGKRNEDGQWELIEIKSSANFGFDKFVEGETPDYIKQAHTLMMSAKGLALGVRSARFFYMKKETSHIFDRRYEFDDELAKTVKTEYMIAAGSEEPRRPHEPADEKVYNRKTREYDLTGRKILGFPCSYCEYKQKCFSNISLEYKSGKPVWTVESRKDGTNG